MVTLRRLDGLMPFSAIEENGVVENAVTRAFNAVIKNFHRQWYVIEPIWCYEIMPDHIHLFISLPTTITVANFVQGLKISTSKWLRANKDFPAFNGWGRNMQHSPARIETRI